MPNQHPVSGQRVNRVVTLSCRLLIALVPLLLLHACAQPSARRPPLRVPSSPSPQVGSVPKGLPQPEPRTAPEQAKPIEKEKKENRSPQQPNYATEGRARPQPQDPTVALPDDSSLVAKISPQTPPRRAASLRLTEEGKKMLASEDYTRALGSLERSIAVDSSNPYNYYYLAKAHYHLASYQESLNFLDVAESHLANEPYWLAETLALRGENFRALGFFQRAESNYAQALKLNPGNKIAGEGMSRLRSVNQRFPR